MIEILSAPNAVVQDRGRDGYYGDGIGRAGAMDTLSLALGNALLGNDEDAAGIEIALFPFKIRFDADTTFSVCGADCETRLNGRLLPPDWATTAKAGQVLVLSPPKIGCRAYLCLQGGVDVPLVLGSRSTQLREAFGGFEGRMLEKGDRLGWIGSDVALPAAGLGVDSSDGGRSNAYDGNITVGVIPAAEYDDFSAASQGTFWNSPWKVTNQSNRTGYRLDGPEIELARRSELRSHGIVPGVVQVPAGGGPIIQLAGAATMGGYPKIATIVEADLWKMGQASPGDFIRFTRANYKDAVASLKELNAFIQRVRLMSRFQHQASKAWAI